MRLLLLVLFLAACSHERIVRELVKPSCEVPSAFERCKEKCLQTGKRPTDAWEGPNQIECHCVAWDA